MDCGATVSNAQDEFAKCFVAAWKEREAKEKEWIKMLRTLGVAAAHPDDGWVNRDENTVQFCYPFFGGRDHNVGDLIALGTPDDYRIVRITQATPPSILTLGYCLAKYHFE